MALLILIVSFFNDAHIPLVTEHLDAMGVPWEHFVTDKMPESSRIMLRVSESDDETRLIVASGRIIDPKDIASVWNRRRIVSTPIVSKIPEDSLINQYIHEQKLSLIENGLDLDHAFWINKQSALLYAKPKIKQLRLACALGMKIPNTLCSDDPVQIRAFSSSLTKRTITKVISPGTPITADAEDQYMIFTQLFEPEKVSDEELSCAPAIYQEQINKRYEARAIVIGNKVLCCRIDSQNSEQTSLDWRHYDFDRVAHRQVLLPVELERKLIDMTKHLGLSFSAIDLAYTTEGDWVFFELNPNGQWGWLEELAGIPIGKTLALELMRGLTMSKV